MNFENMTMNEIYNLGIQKGMCIILKTLEEFKSITPTEIDKILNEISMSDDLFENIKEEYENS